MTLRLCIFGNSHVAALREAWSVNPGRWPGVLAQFVGAHGDTLLQTEVRDGHLVPATDDARDNFARLGGVEKVDLAAYDALVIAGCLMAMPQAVLVHQSMRWTGLPSLARAADIATMKQAFVSHAAARASLCAILQGRLGPTFARHLRQGTATPLWITSQPRYSVDATTSDKAHLRPYMAAIRMGDGPALSGLFEEAASRTAQATGATFIPQHRATIRKDMLTAVAYMRGAKRLSPKGNLPQPPEDFAHANARYGALVIDQIIAAVTGAPAPELSDVEEAGE